LTSREASCVTSEMTVPEPGVTRAWKADVTPMAGMLFGGFGFGSRGG
jgi:hypothetical protein